MLNMSKRLREGEGKSLTSRAEEDRRKFKRRGETRTGGEMGRRYEMWI
jgi:hypothetical protein